VQALLQQTPRAQNVEAQSVPAEQEAPLIAFVAPAPAAPPTPVPPVPIPPAPPTPAPAAPAAPACPPAAVPPADPPVFVREPPPPPAPASATGPTVGIAPHVPLLQVWPDEQVLPAQALVNVKIAVVRCPDSTLAMTVAVTATDPFPVAVTVASNGAPETFETGISQMMGAIIGSVPELAGMLKDWLSFGRASAATPSASTTIPTESSISAASTSTTTSRRVVSTLDLQPGPATAAQTVPNRAIFPDTPANPFITSPRWCI
jgi:hypothetical protein